MISDAKVLEDTIVPAGHPWSRRIAKDEVLRLIDLEGQQAIDFLCYNAGDPEERYHAPNTIKIQGQIPILEAASQSKPMNIATRRTRSIHLNRTCATIRDDLDKIHSNFGDFLHGMALVSARL